MREHMEQIVKTKWLFGMHIVLYLFLALINIAALTNVTNEALQQYRVQAIVFSLVFLMMIGLEVLVYVGTKRFQNYAKSEFWYRLTQILICCLFYFMTPVEIGSGIIMLTIVICFVELVFFFQPDDTGRRVMTYVCLAVAMEVLTVWFVLKSETFYEGINLFISTGLLLLTMIALSEVIIRIYYYFMKKVFAQNRTVDNLNEANDQLREQQNEIKKTNELLGLQKIELQAANKKINRSHDEMSLQNEIGSVITSTMEQDKLLERVCKIIKLRLDLDLVAVITEPDVTLQVPGEEKRTRELYCSHTLGEDYTAFLQNLVYSDEVDELYALTSTYIQNTQDNDFWKKGRDESEVMESLMMIPLMKSDERIGNFIVAKRVQNAFMENRAFYETIASQINIGLSNMRLYEQMHQMAIRDGLTKIFNRRHLTQVLNEYLNDAMKKRTQVCLALFDIDKFKMVNDTYGHSCGDAVIQHVATLLNQAAFVHGGVAGRYGGEEFVIAFKDKSLEEVHEIVKEVHTKIREEEVCYEDKILHVCASAGLAAYPETCKNPAELLNRADWAMYHSKQNGRNQITIDSDQLETKM
nr:diguanylate cyclase [Eubacterium sp.]